MRAQDTNIHKEQAAWGTAETTGFFATPLAGDVGVTYNGNDFGSTRGRVGKAANIMQKGRYDWSLSIPTELEASHLVFYLKQLLGDYTYTVDTPVAGANQHVITDSTTQADIDQILTKGFTDEIGGNAKFLTYDSCIVESIELAEIDQGVVPVTVNTRARARSAVAGTSADTVAVNNVSQLMTTSHGVITAGVDASEVTQDITVGGLTIAREGIEGHFRATPNTAKQWIQTGNLTVKGTFEIEIGDTERAAVLDDFTNSDETSIIFTYTSPVLITGSTYYSITFDMSECKYTSLGKRTDGFLVFEKFEFEAGIDSASQLITITAINTETTF